jgi:hypothetical protein
MFKPDGTLLIQIQIALLGIVMIAGLFYLWRIILRLEERIDSLCKNNTCQAGIPPFQIPPQFADENSQDDIAIAQELMQQVFGGGGNGIDQPPTMMMFSTTLPMQVPSVSENSFASTPKKCVVEEIPTVEPNNVSEQASEQASEQVSEYNTVNDQIPSNVSSTNNVRIHFETHTVNQPVSQPESKVNTNIEIESLIEEIDNSTNISEEDDGNPISKTKLNQMKIEKLRKLCKDRGISAEGLKTQLIDRLLGLTRE